MTNLPVHSFHQSSMHKPPPGVHDNFSAADSLIGVNETGGELDTTGETWGIIMDLWGDDVAVDIVCSDGGAVAATDSDGGG